VFGVDKTHALSEAAEMTNRTRTRVWIDRQIQGALAVRVAIHWCLFALIVSVLTVFLQFIGNPLAPLSQHLQNFWRNQGAFLIVMAITLPIFVYDTIKLSNRFAGPVLRLRRIMREIAEGGAVEKLSFRDHDFWRGLAEDFNRLVDRGHFDTKPTSVDDAQPDESELQEVS
jgi:hypothetical protein